MKPDDIKIWTEVAKNVVTIAGLLIGAFWAWSRFVVERGLMPPSQLDLTLTTVDITDSAALLEILVQIANKGSSALIVTDLQVRIRYADEDNTIQVVDDPSKSFFGRVNFPNASVLHRIGADKRVVKNEYSGQETKLSAGEFLVVPYDTFVQPGIDQVYTFVTALPRTAKYALIRASFRYQLKPSKTQITTLRLSRKVGMIQYSLNHIREPHTVERIFKISSAVEKT